MDPLNTKDDDIAEILSNKDGYIMDFHSEDNLSYAEFIKQIMAKNKNEE